MKRKTDCFVFLAATLLVTANLVRLPSIPIAGATTVTVEVGVFWDDACTRRVSSINWGAIQPGAAENQTVYVRNESNSTVALCLAARNWNPVDASNYIRLNWDYSGESVGPNRVLQTTLTLSISPEVKGIASFSFEMVLSTICGGLTYLELTVPGICKPGESVPVAALLVDSSGNPLPNQQVHFYISGYPLPGSLAPWSAYTDGDGVVNAVLTLPSAPSTLVLDAVYYGTDYHYASSQLKTIAVLPIYQTNLTALASPVNIASQNTSTITFRLEDEHGNPVANQSLSFKTTAGNLSSTGGFTDSKGQTSVVLAVPSLPMQVVVFASFAGLLTKDAVYQPSEGGVGISVDGTMTPTALRLTTLASLASLGKTVTLRAMLLDHSGVPLGNKTVYFVTRGLATPQMQSSLTNSEGVATATVTMPNASAVDVVNCFFAGDSSHLASEQLKVVAALPIFQTALAATVSGQNIAVGTASNITFTLRDERGNPLSGQRLAFLTTDGGLSAQSGTTNSDGVVTVTLTASGSNTAVVSASFGGYLSDSVYQPSMVRRGIFCYTVG